MGSWNETCFLSGLSILAREPVVAFVMCDDRRLSGVGATFMSPPIYGVYNDYGGVTDIEETWYAKALVKRLSKDPQVQFADERASYLEEGQLPIDLHTFLDHAERGDYLVKTDSKKSIALTLAHHQLFEAGVQSLVKRDCWYRSGERVKAEDLKTFAKPTHLSFRSRNPSLFFANSFLESLLDLVEEPDYGAMAKDLNGCLDAHNLSCSLRRPMISWEGGRGSQEDNTALYAHFLPSVRLFAERRAGSVNEEFGDV